MIFLKKHLLATVFFSLFLVVMIGCKSKDDPKPDDHEPSVSGCEVQLFDGDHFKDDSIVVEGPAEYRDLTNLPHSDGKDWTDEADAMRVGDGAQLTVWLQTGFEGDSTNYSSGDYPSVDEPYSIKIACE